MKETVVSRMPFSRPLPQNWMVEIIAALSNTKRRRLFDHFDRDKPSSFSGLCETTELSAPEVHNNLRVLLSAGLIEAVSQAPIISDETGRPVYRFYRLSEAGRYIYDRFGAFCRDIDNLVSLIGIANDKYHGVNVEGIRIRLRILLELFASEAGLTVTELLGKLSDLRLSYPNLSYHLSRLNNLVESQPSRLDGRKRIYSLRLDKSRAINSIQLLMVLRISSDVEGSR